MKKILLTSVSILVVVLVYLGFVTDTFRSHRITDFISCSAYGNPVMETYPRQCRDKKGNNFVEKIDVSDLIRISTVFNGDKITSPVSIKGEARGTWFFEASFPVFFEDSKGKVFANSIGTTTSDWMTEDFIPFKTTVKFSVATETPGFIVLKRDNPSGNIEFDRELRIPIIFVPNKESDIINQVSQ